MKKLDQLDNYARTKIKKETDNFVAMQRYAIEQAFSD
jgi:hypothetical protein